MRAGTTLGPYRVEHELGSGGMGKVYAATVEGRCPGLRFGAPVALKVIHPHLLDTPGFFKRFLREARLGQAIDHENVVRTLDCDATHDAHFLIMEYVEGQTLRELLDELERVPEELCRHIGREVAKGLGAIHAAGIIHRDIKPENVIISLSEAKPDDHVTEWQAGQRSPVGDEREGRAQPQYRHEVKVMDLGVARLQQEAVRLSQSGAFVGSLHHAAPEQFARGGADVDQRADLHALGLLLYELSCGVNPFVADDVPQIVRRVLDEVPRRLGEINPQLSPFFEEVVHCLLEKDREARFGTADEVLAVLEAGEDSAWWRGRSRALQLATRRPLRRMRIPRETALYGRDDELLRLRELFDRACEREGQVLLLNGEAGIGKSRLIDEFVGRLHQEGEDVDFLHGSYPPGGAATAAGAFSTAYRERLGEAGSGAYLAENRPLIPSFDALLAGDPPPAGCEPLAKETLQTCFVRVTQALAAERPVVVLIDDLHFAPDEGRALFAALALSIAEHRVLLVGTQRRGHSRTWVAGVGRLDHASEMTLSRLGPKDLFKLLEETLRSEHMAAELAGKIGLKSDGNPFFVFEIVNGLRDGRYLKRADDGSWVSTALIAEIEIPSSVMDLVNGRVATLAEEERDLLDVAACYGFRFDPSLVGEVAGLSRIVALKRFGQIERRHRLVRSAGRELEFDHHQVQEALYGSLLEPLREEYHGAIARALEARLGAAGKTPEQLGGARCLELCEHFLRSGRGEPGRRYLQPALEHLSDGALVGEAAALAERALATPDLLAGAERVDGLIRLTSFLSSAGRRSEERAAAEQAVRIAEELGEDELRLRAHRALGTCLLATEDLQAAEEHYEASRALAIRRSDRAAEGHAERGLGLVHDNGGDLDRSLAHTERALTIARETDDKAAEAAVSSNLGNLLLRLGRTQEAEATFERAIELARESGNRRWEAAAIMNLGGVYHARHEFGRALAQAREAYDRFAAAGQRRGELSAIMGIAMTLARMGVHDQARVAHERCRALASELGLERVVAQSLVGLGRIADQTGDRETAVRHFEDAVSRLGDDERGRSLDAAARRHLVRLAWKQGDTERMRSHLERRGIFESVPDAATIAQCYRALLDEAELAPALAMLGSDEGGPESMMEARFVLWHATDDVAHLRAARRLYEELRDAAPDEYRDTQLARPLYRDVAQAWEAHGDD